MCGICLSLTFRSNSDEVHVQSDLCQQDLSTKLKHRGPDNYQKIKASCKSEFDLHLIASVLHLQGNTLELQPIQDEKGNILLWNGEIFDGLLIQESQSDTTVLSKQLFSCSQVNEVLEVIKLIKGPYAFIFYQVSSELIWFGRDIFGRRSLLWISDFTSFNLCSISGGVNDWKEVPTKGLFCIDLKQSQSAKSFVIRYFPWAKTASGLLNQETEFIPNLNFTVQTMSSTIEIPISKPLNRSLPSDDMIPKCFGELPENVDFQSDISWLLKDSEFKSVLMDFENELCEAVKKRVQNQPNMCKDCYKLKDTGVECSHASVGVLFSGGLDSIVLAALSHRYLKENVPIDLINVAFASNSKLKDNTIKENVAFDTPDRLTGRNGASALQKLIPERLWNFVEVNVSEEELINERKNRISQLLKPSLTVLDDSIGCAIWFAARGKGKILQAGSYHSYRSGVRVLLVGMGADEQLGGYSRHRAKFKNFGWSGLIDELALELDRIGSRNLGRDDRIITDHGIESRYPFLDENVVSFLNDLPVWLKMNLNLPRGLGEKFLLRLLALKIGLKEAAVLPKRAIQFGSRIARIENSKEKGSDICERLKKSL